ncbi:MAG: glycosyltransferase family 9 protein [Gilvibacter sp.]
MNSSAKHIAIVRLSALGDVAMTVPVIGALSQQYPELQISVVSKPFVKPLFAHLSNVTFIEAHVYDAHKGVLGLRKLSKIIAAQQLDAFIDLHNVIRTKILRSFIRMQGVKVSVIDKGRAQKKALTRPKNKVWKPLETTAERYTKAFAAAGFPINWSSIGSASQKPLREAAAQIMGDWKGKAIAIAPFAAYEAKMYPLDLMRQVMEQLTADNRFKLFLFGGGEKEKAHLMELSKGLPNTEVVVGKMDFASELALISNMDLMISMDSANGHLAAIFGIPVLTLWGATHPFLGFVPHGQPEENQLLPDLKMYPEIPTSVYGNKLPESHKDVMRSISPEQVAQKAQNLLQ